MLAEQRLRDGQLDAALEALQDEVRRAPSDPKLRVFLFQLLAVLGQWERALKQLQVAASFDAEALAMAQAYRELIRCEVLRAEVFQGRRTPSVIGDPEPWLASLVQALRLTAEGHHAEAESLRQEAFSLAPASTGRIEGADFEWLADADSRLGPVLETVIRGRYHWVPMCRLRGLEVERPRDLRDLVWLPAKLRFQTGDETACFIPARYPGSERSTDDAVRLARKTVWLELGGATACGLGQRMLVTDHSELGLFELPRIDLTPFSEAATQQAVALDRAGEPHG